MNQTQHRYRVKSLKRQSIKAILKIVSPLFYDSGYVKNPMSDESRPLRLVALVKECRPAGLYAFAHDADLMIYAFTEDGVIVDAYGGGAVTHGYDTFCLEDLFRLRSLVERWPLTKYNQPAKAA